MKSLTYIYALVDPRDGQVRYIGKTSCTLSLRLSRHIASAKHELDSAYHRLTWLRKLLALGLLPEIRELERNPTDWAEAEARWIQHGRSHGWDLTNGTLGGEGYPTVDYTKLDPILGTMTDAAAAAIIGCSSTTVRHRRHAFGIPDFRAVHGIPKLRIILPSAAVAQLGITPDEQLARAFGVSPQTIGRARASLGISAAVPPGGAVRRINLPSEAIAQLGILSDSQIAKRFNVGKSSVHRLRKRLGIPPAN